MDISVRLAQPDDLATIADFNTRLASETEGKTLDQSIVRRGVAALIADPNKGRYFLAQANQEVVGQSAVSYEWSDWRNGWIWWLQSVYVRSDWRGKGVFRKLFEAISDAAKKEGVIGLRLYVEQGNAAGQSTYHAVGMELTSYQCFERLF